MRTSCKFPEASTSGNVFMSMTLTRCIFNRCKSSEVNWSRDVSMSMILTGWILHIEQMQISVGKAVSEVRIAVFQCKFW